MRGAADFAQGLAEWRHITQLGEPTSGAIMSDSEALIQQQVRIAASRKGWRVWRNNVGAGTLQNGSHVRWGLANESAAMNHQYKSSDLIGIKPMLILPEHVGTVGGVVVAIYAK